MHFRQIAALAASVTAVSAIRGFNTGNQLLNGSNKQQSDFAAEFSNQRQLVGTDGAFTAARLYTMIQGGTTNTPISAIPAAMESNTQLMLGLWASAGQDSFNLELAALRSAIEQYGASFAKLVTGISVGSEDLYRITPTGIMNKSGLGAGPDVIASYIGQVRKVIQGTALASAPVGHVDTWTAWVNGSNSAAIDACDFVGMNTFPYFQTTDPNSIQQAAGLFYKALSDTRGAVGGKPVIVTETGYPWQGPNSGDAVASIPNARTYWKQVYCTLPEDVDLFWYTQRDGNSADAATFGVTTQELSTTPEYDLSCNVKVSSSSSSSSVSATHKSTATGSAVGAGATAGHSASASHSGSASGFVTAGSATKSASAHSAASTSPALYITPTSTAPYVVGTGMTTAAAGAGTGTGSLPAPSSTLAPFEPNSASNVRGTLALLIVPALMALMA